MPNGSEPARTVHASSAYVVYVAIDEDGRPRPVPPLVPESAEDERRQREARLRRENRMRHKVELDASARANRPADLHPPGAAWEDGRRRRSLPSRPKGPA